jgi:hypothetical protein
MPSLRHAVPLALVLLQPAAALALDQGLHRNHTDLAARLSGLRTIGIVAPEMKIYELTASNEPVFRPDWTEQGREAVTAGLEAVLRGRGLESRRFEPATPEAKKELQEVQLLFQTVVGAVLQAIANQFPATLARFEYSLGDLGPLLEAQGLDAIVFTLGHGAASSGGRKALQVVSALVAGVSSSGVDRLLVGVVDRRGDLLWFGTLASSSSDLRDRHSAGQFVEILARDLPAVGK